MKTRYTIAFDVGGTFIKAANLDYAGNVILNSMEIYDSHSNEDKKYIIENFIKIIESQIEKIKDKEYEILGIGYGFPGPFDYERGISLIHGIGKYDSIYNVNIKNEILDGMKNMKNLNRNFKIAFENDAALFALGESLIGMAKPYDRAICITIGTGAGSSFIEHGKLIKNRYDVPENGWIYNTKFKDSIVDDYISVRGILNLGKKYKIEAENVKEIYEKAVCKDKNALNVFMEFGNNLGEAIIPFIEEFKPDAVIFGGQIVKSKEYFKYCLREKLSKYDVNLKYSKDTSISVFSGVYKLIEALN